ncbi:MAG: peptidoglycan synthetase [Bacteroidetes bacterium]|nr:peptidoglycan synthetase [Bacteroidota bacterium]
MRIHLIACGGAVMHNMAIALHKKGHQVTGSDDVIFDPAKSRLERLGLLPTTVGWNAENITSDIEAVILGMHAKADNPELLKAQELGIKIYSFPEFLYEQSREKTRVVVAGSHGKTTITSMVMYALRKSGVDFDYMVGSSVDGFEDSVRLSDAPIIILEGDEYLTSPIDRRPKFIWYKPHVLLVSGIAWDHVNVFPSLEEYHQQFEMLLEQQNSGALVYYVNDPVLDKMASGLFKPDLFIKPYTTPEYSIENGQTIINHDGIKTPLEIIGQHNLENLEGARLVCEELGVDALKFFKNMQDFTGAGRRLEVLKTFKNGIVYKDFAHSPSKVKASTNAVASQFKNYETVAVLELHTFSSLTKSFLPEYAGCLDAAQKPAVFVNPETLKRKGNLAFTAQEIRQYFKNDDIEFFDSPQVLKDWIIEQGIDKKALLLMSSGNFGGIDFDQVLESLN